MTQLPPELDALAAMLDTLPLDTQAVFQYCLILMMVESGTAELTQTIVVGLSVFALILGYWDAALAGLAGVVYLVWKSAKNSV